MERYALLHYLHQQRQFARRMAPRRPLSAYVADHRQLVKAIGPVSELGTTRSLPRRSLSVEETRFAELVEMAQPKLEQPVFKAEENVPAELAAQDNAPKAIQEEMKHERPAQTSAMSQRKPSPERAVRPVEKSTELSLHDLPSAGEAPAQEQDVETRTVPPTPIVDEQQTRALDLSAPEMPPSEPQEHQFPASQQDRPAPRRARIEEHPLPAPAANPAQKQVHGAQPLQRPERSHPATKVEPQTEAQKEAERESAELFTASAPRSPQEWFSLLAQAGKVDTRATRVDASERARASEASTRTARAGTRAAPTMDGVGSQAEMFSSNQGEDASISLTMSELRQSPVYSRGGPHARFAHPRPVGRSDTPEFASTDGIRARFVRPTRRNDGPEPSHSRSARLHKLSSSDNFSGKPQADSYPGGGNENDAAPADEDRAEVEPISLRAREALKPLVGFDPADARIHRGPAAARFASAQRADAVTVGDDIFLGAGHGNDEPETLGLLAHELTHVARHHKPRFVPPVTNDERGFSVPGAQIEPARIAPQTSSGAPTSQVNMDEEALAEQVEQRVARQATEKTEAPGSLASTSATQAFVPPNVRKVAAQNGWGGLPAPWEPLPNWLASSTPTDGPEQFATMPQAAPSLLPSLPSSGNGQGSARGNLTASASSGSAGKGQAAPAAQRAGLERSLHSDEPPAQGQGSPVQQSEPEPDLDKLARQVYAVLKRRLDVERRRMS